MMKTFNADDFTLTKESLNEKDWMKFEKNLSFLNKSIENKLIYNVDYQDIKESLSNRMRTTFDATTDTEKRQRGWENIPEDIRECQPWLSSFNQVTALEKKLKKIKNKDDSLFLKMDIFVKEYIDLAMTMKELKGYIKKGRKPPANPRVVIENPNKIVKTCPCCFRPIAICKDGTMVNHGYRRFGIGANIGNCPCVGFKPLEVSNEGLLYMKKYYIEKIEKAREDLKTLDAVEEIFILNYKKEKISIKKTDSKFKIYKQRQISDKEYEIKHFNKKIEFFTEKIKNWEPKE